MEESICPGYIWSEGHTIMWTFPSNFNNSKSCQGHLIFYISWTPESNQLFLRPFQYSCLKGSSPTHNLVRLNHLTNEWVDKGNTIIEPLLADYRKSVPFNSLYYCCTKPEANGEQKTESAVDSWFPQKPSSVCRCTFCRRSQLWMGLNNVWCFPRYQAGCLAVLGCD